MLKHDPKKILDVYNLFNKLFININTENNNISYFESLLGLLYSAKLILKVTEKIGIINNRGIIEINKNMDMAVEKAIGDDNINKLVDLINSLQENNSKKH